MSEVSPLELQDRLEIPRIALAIRLRLGRGGLYIFAVESEDARQAVISALTQEIDTEVTWREVQITPKRYDLFLYLQHLVSEEQIDTRHTIFSVTGLPETILAQQKQYPDKQPPFCVNTLNVRREVVPDHNLSVVLWVDEATRKRLPHDAKDFWAFQMETRLFRDAAARLREHFSPPPPAPLDEEIAELRDLLKRYHEQRPDDAGGIGSITFDLGTKLYRRSRFHETQQAFLEALRLYRKVGVVQGQANALNYLGSLAQVWGEGEQAHSYHRGALGLYREVGDVRGQASALGSLGSIARVRGELEQAQRYYQEALGLFRELNAPEGQAEALRKLGAVYRETGDFVLAASYLQEALTLFQAIGAKLEVAKTEDLLKQVHA